MVESRGRTAFISGPLEVSHEYFTHYYEPRITAAITAGDDFVIGPVSGIDALALTYLLETARLSSSRISVYMAGFEVLSRPAFVKELKSKGVRIEEVSDATTTWDRDAAMTNASDHDILRYRTESEQQTIYGERWRARVSNTERNERRRERFRAGDLRGEEEVQVKYIKHVDSPVHSFKRFITKSTSDSCDGKCDGHRDIVYPADKDSVFGFGLDGHRIS